jgi:hypothetical protein
MAHKSLDTYLNDHLAGAMLGSDLAEQIAERNEGTPLGDLMASVSAQIEEDRQSLIDLMEATDSSRNPVKQVTTWIAEKASRPKFNGFTSGDAELGTFLALESLTLGVMGKLSLWVALKQIQSEHAALSRAPLDELIRRAESQRDTLEQERLAASRRALSAARGD